VRWHSPEDSSKTSFQNNAWVTLQQDLEKAYRSECEQGLCISCLRPKSEGSWKMLINKHLTLPHRIGRDTHRSHFRPRLNLPAQIPFAKRQVFRMTRSDTAPAIQQYTTCGVHTTDQARPLSRRVSRNISVSTSKIDQMVLDGRSRPQAHRRVRRIWDIRQLR